jgi:hypothetical protein
VPAQHAGHGRLRHGDAELFQFADDAEVAPARVLLGQAADQLYRLVPKRRTTGAAVWVGPPSPDETAVPVEDRPWRDQKRAPSLSRHETGVEGDDGPIGPGEAGA